MIIIAGLGPSGADRMSVAARRAIESDAAILFRTRLHPAVSDLEQEGISFETCDWIYESAETFDDVYRLIADEVIQKAMAGDVVYCVPGHPLVGEEAVRIILERARVAGIQTRIIGSESFIEASLEAVGASMDEGLKVLDALSVNTHPADPNLPNLFYQVYDAAVASDLKLSLMDVYPDEFEVYLIIGAGTSQEKVEKLPLFELDRRKFDYLTSVFVPRWRQDEEGV